MLRSGPPLVLPWRGHSTFHVSWGRAPVPAAHEGSYAARPSVIGPAGELAGWTAIVFESVTNVLTADPRIAYAFVFGSCARGTQHVHSDLDLAIGCASSPCSVLEIGDLIGRLEAAAGRPVDLILLDEAPPGLAYRVFRDGRILFERDPQALANRKERAILDYLDWKPSEDLFVRAGRDEVRVVDKLLLAKSLADIRDAVARIRQVLPLELEAFARDRTIREVVVLNLFVALQQCLSVTTRWLADARLDVPAAYREACLALGAHGVLSPELTARLGSSSGLRNLIAHCSGVLDWLRIYTIAATQIGDLLEFCYEIERNVGRS
ncbi:MAG TPA: HepT-like ribonuclease domain-containing protein [Planctomycetota bacterium]|nr:HepT-like ribonuclease domain-containing protein [Planctomycetota bacterium]